MTDPEIYRSLHGVAEESLDDLEGRFDVAREEVRVPTPDGAATQRAVRLVPAAAGAAAMTVVFTDFPGLLVRLGQVERDNARLAWCGCDACDASDACDETVPMGLVATSPGALRSALTSAIHGVVSS